MALNLGIFGLQERQDHPFQRSNGQPGQYDSRLRRPTQCRRGEGARPRLEVLADMFHPRKVVHADVQFTDVPGMSAAARESGNKEPVSRQTLGFISTVDALVLVVRAFENASVPLPEGSDGVDPVRDVDTIMLEMAFSGPGHYRAPPGTPEGRDSQDEGR